MSEGKKQSVWLLQCELGIISDDNCPVDGGWSPWSFWSSCSGRCDGVAYRRRFRQCINPSPSRDGLPCIGSDIQTEPCFLKNCTVEDFRKLVESDAIRKEALHQLEALPELMEHCLQMECPYEAIEAVLANNNIWQINPEAIWNSFQCVQHNLGCPVVGEWGSWSDWSACGARCGYGLRWRYRKCDTPPPSHAHLYCVGTPLQIDECLGDQCAINSWETSGIWGDWSQWSSCSENCGTGVRSRKRSCNEMSTPRLFYSWGTHCRGQYNQYEICKNRECKLDGGWTGWGSWGPCSKSCGAGRRSRSRSCTRPVPAGKGATCSGSKTEVGSCHLAPCETYVHQVAVFNGESFLHYNFGKKRAILFHFYTRFLSLSPNGILVRRGMAQDPFVRLSLQKWHLCLDARGLSHSCIVPTLCSRSIIEPAVWHTALVTVTSEATTLRLDDQPVTIRSTFSCDPELPNEKIDIFVGERFHGEIQELILNFIPLFMNKTQYDEFDRPGLSNLFPTIESNVGYEKVGIEESYLILENDHFLRLPCFDDQMEWIIKLTLKPKTASGTILFLYDKYSNYWVHLYIQNMRVKLEIGLKDLRSESLSASEYLPELWVDITLSKQYESNTLETTINANERLHVVIDNIYARLYENFSVVQSTKPIAFVICTDEFFIGGLPTYLKVSYNFENVPTLQCVIASVTLNKLLLDLYDFAIERDKNGKTHVSSRTASTSGSYHEITQGTNRINLTCLHARTNRSPNTAYWLFLDIVVSGKHKEKSVRSIDDGRVLRLVATAKNDLSGFYTCRAHNKKRTRNIVTYGVLGKTDYRLSGPDMTTAVAVFTTLTLVLGTLLWLIIEGVHDIRDGYGFFRDAHLSPEQEADAVCKYIDQNINLFENKKVAYTNKLRARKIGKQIASQSNLKFPKPKELSEKLNNISHTKDIIEFDGLSPQHEIKSVTMEPSHEVFRCEQSYISSPRHGSISSPRSMLASASSPDMASPRSLYSHLLLGKHLRLSRESTITKRNQSNQISPSKSKLLTIKSSTFENLTLPHKILQKFQQLKSDDL